jgi:flagellar motor switch protein FliG
MALKQFQDTSKANAIIKLQNAFRNKKAIDLFSSRYADKVLQERKAMNTANDVISQINKERQIANVNDLMPKLKATSIANDMTNNLFANALNQIPQNSYNLRPKKSTTIKQVEKSLKAVKKKIKK